MEINLREEFLFHLKLNPMGKQCMFLNLRHLLYHIKEYL